MCIHNVNKRFGYKIKSETGIKMVRDLGQKYHQKNVKWNFNKNYLDENMKSKTLQYQVNTIIKKIKIKNLLYHHYGVPTKFGAQVQSD